PRTRMAAGRDRLQGARRGRPHGPRGGPAVDRGEPRWPDRQARRLPRVTTRAAPASAVGLVVIGLVCQELGASVAVLLFPAVGPLGMVMLRLVFSALILLLIARPRLRGHGRAGWLAVVQLGLALAVMNSTFYLALERLPLGVTVTIEVL